MIRMLIAGSTLVLASVGTVLVSAGPAQANPVCVFVSTSGAVDLGPVGTCIPQYPLGVNCQDLTVGLEPTQTATVSECAPRP